MHFKSTHNFLPMFYINFKKTLKCIVGLISLYLVIGIIQYKKRIFFQSTFTVLISDLHIQVIQISENRFVF